MAASLDHALWFHRPFRADDWLLYAQDLPNLSGARGFARGLIFTRDGTLVASVAQEGLLRERRPQDEVDPESARHAAPSPPTGLGARRRNAGHRVRHRLDGPRLRRGRRARARLPATATSIRRANTAPSAGWAKRSAPRASPRERDLRHHQGVGREPARRRFRPLGGNQPRSISGSTSVDLLLVHWPNREIPLARDHGRAGQGEAGGPDPPCRRCQLHGRAARRGGRAVPRAAGHQPGRVSSLSRSIEGLAAMPPSRPDPDRPLPARPRTAAERSGARRDRRAARARPPRRSRCAGRCSRTRIVPIPRSTNPQRIAENIDIFDFSLSDAEMARIAGLTRPGSRIADPKGRAPDWD